MDRGDIPRGLCLANRSHDPTRYDGAEDNSGETAIDTQESYRVQLR